ncbi:hypothetical protein HDU97_006413 [Phlyctochytrium planicorne]|nr:hypothetical protein HDU97_006413 [Phlyctochytrium planicorne]
MAALTTKSQRGHDGLQDIHDAVAPWGLTVSKSFVFTFNVGKHNVQDIQKFLHHEDDKADFLGEGPSSIMIVRYADTPVGAYDELLIMAGAHKPRGKIPNGPDGKPLKNPRSGKLLGDRRIPLIWVSSEASLRCGRKNWGIRKELADFNWVETDKGTRVTIRERHSRPGSPAGSILVDITCSTPLGPFLSIPTTTWGPVSSVLPPLIQRKIDEDGKDEGGWWMTGLSFSGWTRPATVVQIHESGPGVPDFKKLALHPIGGMLTGLLTFEVPDSLED